MFFKLFKKDSKYFIERGDRYFSEKRFAEARHEYSEALQRFDNGSAELHSHVKNRLNASNNELARMNLIEAEHSLQRGDLSKSIEHAELALHLAEDDTLRGNAKNFVNKVTSISPEVAIEHPSHSCSGCNPLHKGVEANDDFNNDFLSLGEQFELLIQPLPGNLPERYRQMGEKFAYAYTAVHDDRVDEGVKIFKELAKTVSSDILTYEIAIIDFRNGNLTECENGLKLAIALNKDNPLSYLGLVQLMVETDRLLEAIPILELMIRDGHLEDQATIMLGDILYMIGNHQAALDRYISALDFPAAAKAAAQKAAPLLEELGRPEDARQLAKRYLKGCC